MTESYKITDAITIQESYDLLTAVCRAEPDRYDTCYRQMRFLLERLCRELTRNESLQITDLGARIQFVAAQTGLTPGEQNRLHTFRLLSNDILNKQCRPEREQLLRDVKTLAFFIRKCFRTDIPPVLLKQLPQSDATYLTRTSTSGFTVRMRVCFHHRDENFLYVSRNDSTDEELLRVRWQVEKVNDAFQETCQLLWPFAQLNLLDVTAEPDGTLVPGFIVLEPDYLIDISSLAECFRDYGHHPANYLLARLQQPDSTRAILLGNIANLFLDEWIHAEEAPDYRTCMTKAFRRYPIELAACEELKDKQVEAQFFNDCKTHFENLRNIVCETLKAPGYDMDKRDAVLEPSYICEALGLQGRLDYMQRDMSSLIEMKSGKADEYSLAPRIVPKENNKVQMLLYQAVLQYAMGRDHHNVKAYLLYTRYPLLYPAVPSWAMVRRAINLRNRIVATEYSVQTHNSPDHTAEILAQINPETLNERHLTGKLWKQFLAPAIERVQSSIGSLNELEKRYFYSVYNFITKELYTAKSGDTDYEGRTGTSALWLSTLAEKLEAGEIIYNLSILQNHASDPHKASILFKRPEENAGEENALPNFREGDAIILYERNRPDDLVTNKQVFKGNIEQIGPDSIQIRLRATQQNAAVLPAESHYAIEHDTTMETTFRSMYQGLAAFAAARKERRDLLLGTRPPEFDESYDPMLRNATDDFARIAWKAKAARDYFLLIGPPGTGKTSCALRQMVERFLEEPDTHLLLLSYTNRAVDEICKSISAIQPQPDYLRIGSELSCEPQYRPHLIENQLADCTRRTQVAERIQHCRVFVGTVAAIAGKPELFKLKKFQVAIIDEATQILEPQLLGLLCNRCPSGDNAIGKFILIGDHKQLPAVVLQNEQQSEVTDEILRRAGITNLRISLFERLYRQNRAQLPAGQEPSDYRCRTFDMLCRQGRMHPEVASFANRAFYENRLVPLGLPHQQEEDTSGRLFFIPSEAEPMGNPAKLNHSEARLAAAICRQVFLETGNAFESERTLGVITPYRSQIALIRKEIARLGIRELESILIDTVERFQGSERDVIVYSFCVNYPYQLKFLSNLTCDNQIWIDRKLNVALTRARKKLYITGVPELLRLNPIYRQLIENLKTTDAARFNQSN